MVDWIETKQGIRSETVLDRAFTVVFGKDEVQLFEQGVGLHITPGIGGTM
jgi:hypothetical protein